MDFQSLVLLTIFIIGFLAFFIVLTKMQNRIKEKVFLLLYIFSISHYSLVVFLIHSGFILNYPHFFRTASPFLYCLPISFFLYYKEYKTTKSSKKDLHFLLFLIPVIHIIELLPFYWQTSSEKRGYLLSLSENPDLVIYSYEGWIPTSWHFILQLFLGLFLFSLVFIDTLKPSPKIKVYSKTLSAWFKWASVFQILCFSCLLFFLIIDSPKINVYGIATLFFGCIQLIIILNLFLQPQALYGQSFLETSKRLPNRSSSISMTDEEIQCYYLKIEHFFKIENSFLQTNFRLKNLAESLDISTNKLSFIINSVYDLNFNQLLNKKRIEAVLKNFNNHEVLEKYSLSALGQEAGFKSRTTFIKAFKKNTGMTPSKYIEQNHKD